MDADVLVIGGGPAGSTAANLLARAGHRVRVLEKSRFPRFHVGESLLPIDTRLYEPLGFVPTPEHYVLKRGADFLDERSGDRAEYFFSDGLPGTPPHAWQAERSKLDARLLALAAEAGAEVFDDTRATGVDIGSDRVTVESTAGRHTARYLIDATGQDAFLARRGRATVPIKGFGVAAVISHYVGLSDEASAELEETGNVRILIQEQGWGWIIPLRGNRMSYGTVSRQPGVRPELLAERTAASPYVRRLTEGATQTEPQVLRNFAYRNRDSYGPRHACVGDASAFLDPVFSSGVTLAMQGAAELARVLSPALSESREDAPDLAASVQAHLRHGYECFGTLIHSFYSTNIVQHLFFNDDPDPELRAGLISMLAGDVWRDDNRFQQSLMRSRRRFRLPD